MISKSIIKVELDDLLNFLGFDYMWNDKSYLNSCIYLLVIW